MGNSADEVPAAAQALAEPPAISPPTKRPRRHDIDWLRVGAMLAVFFFHNARFFDDLDWHVKNPQRSTAAFVFVGFLTCWQMPLLMLVAGAGSWFALNSKTAGQYVLERIYRLLVPLYTIGFFLLIPPQFYWDQVTKGRFSGSFLALWPKFLATLQLQPGPDFLAFWSGHLWFLRDLFLSSLLALPLMLYLKSPSGRRLMSGIARWCDRPGGLLVLALPIVIFQAGLRPRFAPGEHGPADFIYLLGFFLTGYLLMADALFTHAIKRHMAACPALGIVTFLVPAWLVFATGYTGWKTPNYSPLSMLFFGLFGLSACCWVAFLLGISTRYLNRDSPLLAYANEAVLPFYVLHQTVILAVGWYVVRWHASIPAKYATIAATSFVLIMATYELFIRRIGALRFLFGMRPAPKRPAL